MALVLDHQAAIELPGAARRRGALAKLLHNHAALFGLAIVIICVFAALFANWIMPYDPIKPNYALIRKPASALHWFGTDELGRDILSRVILGARISLSAGLVSAGIAVGLGSFFGVLAGYVGGTVDMVISRIADALLATPFLIVAIVLATFLGPSLANAMIAIGIAAAPVFTRLARAQVIDVNATEYVDSARALGFRNLRIVVHHILPNIAAPLIVQATLTMAQAVTAEASLSFLGLGEQPPIPSWGAMLNSAKSYLTQAPGMSLWPGLAIFLSVLGFNLVGDALRDALDPRQE
jgi:peptide/nickel transport system permease protein